MLFLYLIFALWKEETVEIKKTGDLTVAIATATVYNHTVSGYAVVRIYHSHSVAVAMDVATAMAGIVAIAMTIAIVTT